jgi:E3 ubiquitin-protein ligase HERC1
MVWKLIANDSLTLEDLEGVDLEFVRSLRVVKNTSQDTFQDSFGWMDFTLQSTDERTVELQPGGASMQVTWANRGEYVRLAEEYRLHEFDRQVRETIAGEGRRLIWVDLRFLLHLSLEGAVRQGGGLVRD